MCSQEEILKRELELFEGCTAQEYIDNLVAQLEPSNYSIAIYRSADFNYALKHNVELPYDLIVTYKNQLNKVEYELKRKLFAEANAPAILNLKCGDTHEQYELPRDLNQLKEHKDILIDMVHSLVIFTKAKNMD